MVPPSLCVLLLLCGESLTMDASMEENQLMSTNEPLVNKDYNRPIQDSRQISTTESEYSKAVLKYMENSKYKSLENIEHNNIDVLDTTDNTPLTHESRQHLTKDIEDLETKIISDNYKNNASSALTSEAEIKRWLKEIHYIYKRIRRRRRRRRKKGKVEKERIQMEVEDKELGIRKENHTDASRRKGKNKPSYIYNVCNNGTRNGCGPHSKCKEVDGKSCCSCIDGFEGKPPNCWMNCTKHEDCPQHMACHSSRCFEPCAQGACGFRAICNFHVDTLTCACPSDHVGDPHVTCVPTRRSDPAPVGWWARNRVVSYMDRCSGGIVGMGFVITAAHCYWKGDEEDMYVVVDRSPIQRGERRAVLEHYIHPDYTTRGHFDFMILRLSRNEFSDRYIVGIDYKYQEWYKRWWWWWWGDVLEAYGHRNTRIYYPDPKPRYQYMVSTRATSMRYDKCQELLEGISYADNAACTFNWDDKQDNCLGDSGGPVVNKHNYLVGIVIWGVGCDPTSYPSTYGS